MIPFNHSRVAFPASRALFPSFELLYVIFFTYFLAETSWSLPAQTMGSGVSGQGVL
jgi:hypothetical protein